MATSVAVAVVFQFDYRGKNVTAVKMLPRKVYEDYQLRPPRCLRNKNYMKILILNANYCRTIVTIYNTILMQLCSAPLMRSRLSFIEPHFASEGLTESI